MADEESELDKAKKAGAIEGFPEDGDDANDDDTSDSGNDDQKPKAKKQEDDISAKLAALESKLSRLEGENAALRAVSQPRKDKKQEEQEPDWEEMLFTDPNGAIKHLKQSIRREIEADLTTRYQQDKSADTFWAQFYEKNKDLKDDDDLVKAILSTNMAKLADLPVSEASEKLAELTRARILRYTGSQSKGGKKAVAEGGGGSTSPKEDKKPQTVVTLSDVIRARRAKRMNKGKAQTA